MPRQPEVAFYYPGPVWHDANAIKNMLLFFDGIGLLVPDYLHAKPAAVSPELAIPLQKQGLLHILTPETFIDKSAAEELATEVANLIHSGRLDHLDKSEPFHELSMSRLGYHADEGLGKMLFEELRNLGLARPTADGKSIPMQRHVRYLILVLLSQILRSRGNRAGLRLVPATDRPELVSALSDLLEHSTGPSAGHVVATDLSSVGVDLSDVPLDEVLSFRTMHRKEHRAYATAVRMYVVDLSQLAPAERTEALRVRRTELRDLAADLGARSTSAWGKKPLSYVLGAAGALWKAAKGDKIGGLFAATALLAGYDRKPTHPAGSFSYLFSARHLHHHH
jgi:hypothetical protein